MTESVPDLLCEAARRLQRAEPSRVAVAAHVGERVWMEGRSSDLYEIGSVTKVFVGSLLAEFVEHGRLSLDDRVSAHLTDASPELSTTLRELVSHTSGLPRLPKNFRAHIQDVGNPYACYTEEALTRALAEQRAPTRARGRHAYSNYGFAVLGRVLARCGGANIGALVRERLCEPLSLRDTSMELDAEQARRLLPGSSARGKARLHWSLAAFAAAGALKSTPTDLLRFVQAQTSGDHALAPVFSRARDTVWRGRHHAMGYAWFSSPLGEHEELWHTGGTGGFSSYVGFVPSRSAGVVVLVNHGLSIWGALVRNPVEHVGRNVLRRLLES
jgi:serine-type D-Ala-D-Ala carboxypeptidase/endopeptidase